MISPDRSEKKSDSSLLIHVDAEITDLARLRPAITSAVLIRRRAGVNQQTPHFICAIASLSIRWRVPASAGNAAKYIRSAVERREIRILHTRRNKFRILALIMRQNAAPSACMTVATRAPIARPDNPGGAPVEVEAQQSSSSRFRPARGCSPHNPAVQRQHKRQRVLRHRMGRMWRHANHRDPALLDAARSTWLKPAQRKDQEPHPARRQGRQPPRPARLTEHRRRRPSARTAVGSASAPGTPTHA